MTCRVACLAAFLTLALSAGRADLNAQRESGRTVLMVERWTTAVMTHRPGRADGSVEFVNALTADERKVLNEGLAVFQTALIGRVVTTSTETKRIAEMGADFARKPGPNAFLARAAALHAAAAMVAPYTIAPAPAAGPMPGIPPGGLVAANDGEYHGVILPNWGWAFARRLLDLTVPGPAGDPFVASWYHATAAFMMKHEFFGEVAPHLERAMQLFSNDARIVFDKACLAETLGLPRARQVLDDPRTRQALAQPRLQPGTRVGAASNNVVVGKNDLMSKAQTEAEAERLFRRVLSLDPTMAEAHIRLGRLYESQGRHGDALRELSAGLAASKDDVARFYEHLFSARASRALKRPQDAASHVKQALALFPNAQSALLASSQLALVHADASGALLPIQQLARTDPDTRGDPWWHYHVGMGRYADTVLDDLWARVKEGS
jgi:tetratricopeptide (TPR) repeat protein